jgi:RNA polymerase sigma-70 factor (family 1)
LNHAPLKNENDVLVNIARGETGAFQMLFEHYYHRLYSTALMNVKVHETAEDVVQQVFLKIWQRRADMNEVASIGGYLVVTVRNEILNCRRREAVRARYIDQIKELFSEESATPEQNLIAKQHRDILRRAAMQLPRQQREAWQLSRDKGMSYAEIAAQMRIALPTVKGNISAALRFIRQFIATHRDSFLMFWFFWSLLR